MRTCLWCQLTRCWTIKLDFSYSFAVLKEWRSRFENLDDFWIPPNLVQPDPCSSRFGLKKSEMSGSARQGPAGRTGPGRSWQVWHVQNFFLRASRAESFPSGRRFAAANIDVHKNFSARERATSFSSGSHFAAANIDVQKNFSARFARANL